MNHLLLLAIVLVASVGQLLLKLAVDAGKDEAGTINWWVVAHDWRLWAGIFAYAVTSLGWLFALSRLPLATAYPYLALTFVAVPLLAVFALGERLGILDYLSIGLIISGVALLGFKSSLS